MRKILSLLFVACALPVSAQVLDSAAPKPPRQAVVPPKPKVELATSAMETMEPIKFLLGTWMAKTTPAGSAEAKTIGTYTFSLDLAGHVMQRTTSSDVCTGPASYDCHHQDELSIFIDQTALDTGKGFKPMVFALYLDSEGHVIYYAVTSPKPNTAQFLSQGPPDKPTFRLTYTLTGTGADALMTGRFEFAAPGSKEFKPYLVWSGQKL
jgi:hypothetical protein